MGREEEFTRVQRQRESAAFAQQVHAGTVTPLDRFGNAIKVDQLVIYKPPIDLVFTVKAISPVLDPRMPAGLVQVELTVVLPVHLPVRQPTGNIIVVGMVERIAQVPAADPAAPVDPGADSPDAAPRAIEPPSITTDTNLPAAALPLAPPLEEPPL